MSPTLQNISNSSPYTILPGQPTILVDKPQEEDTSSLEITIPSGAHVTLLSIGRSGSILRNIQVLGSGSLDVFGIIVGKLNHKCSFNMNVTLSGTNTKGTLHLLGIATEKSILTIGGTIHIPEGGKSISGYVHQKNILLGTTSSIQGVPVLDIATNDVEAGHSCSMSRISDEHLFYLKSHGMPTEDAEILMIEGALRTHLACILGVDEEQYNTILDELKTSILG